MLMVAPDLNSDYAIPRVLSDTNGFTDVYRLAGDDYLRISVADIEDQSSASNGNSDQPFILADGACHAHMFRCQQPAPR